MHAQSDLDVLVVMPDGLSQKEGLVYEQARKEGRELDHAA
jgi:hypothetical protein